LALIRWRHATDVAGNTTTAATVPVNVQAVVERVSGVK
jgi:hypothetical protein